jgi:hypothetical protein
MGRVQLTLETELVTAFVNQADQGWLIMFGDTRHLRPREWTEDQVKAAVCYLLSERLMATVEQLIPGIAQIGKAG